MVKHHKYIDREKSWLAFNERVLQEASDIKTPLLDRLKFLGIFSNNLDEFFRVRFAILRRLSSLEVPVKFVTGNTPHNILNDITQKVIYQQDKSIKILASIEKDLKKHQIHVVNELELVQEHQVFIRDYFIQKVAPELLTIILNEERDFPHLKDSAGYFAVKMILKQNLSEDKKNNMVQYAIIEFPKSVNRFVELPAIDGEQYIIMLDDIIRYHLHMIFTIFDFETIEAYMIKVTRDSELDLDSDLGKSLVDKISLSVKHRKQGDIVRFVYDDLMPSDLLNYVLKKLNITEQDSIIPGGRYHNRRDYMKFPNLNRKDLLFNSPPPLAVKGLSLEGSILQKLKVKDYMIHTPYQSYAYIIKFLREAALDTKVTTIKITLYRLAENSRIISSLINAVKNGKKVVVQIELQARFDEASNIFYSKLMQEEGIELVFGVKGLKVHCKVCMIERLESGKIRRYGFISTGNFNESTAKIYTDVTLLTSHQSLLKDASKVFNFFDTNYKVHRYKHLILSPHSTRKQFAKLIKREIEHAKSGKEAFIKLKMNSLTDIKTIDLLYDAGQAGVKIQLIIRGMCCLIPQKAGLSENIGAISIVDQFLEHTRVYIFGNNGEPEVYISSADFMSRNLDKRVEVTSPIYSSELKQELIETFEICWKGNVKVRLHDENMQNLYKKPVDGEPDFRAQLKLYDYYKNKLES